MKEINDSTFATEVLARSTAVPVVVDFWAPWCGPCRQLAPMLEQEVAALEGRVELKKLNTDENTQMPGAYAVSSLPTVIAFHNGKPVSQFVGLQPAHAIRRWLEGIAPSSDSRTLERARTLIAAGNLANAEPLLVALGHTPLAAEAAVVLADCRLRQGQVAGVAEIIATIEAGTPGYERVPHLRCRAELLALAAPELHAELETAIAENPDDLEARYRLAASLYATEALDAALDQLLSIVGRDRQFRGDAARIAVLAIFDQLGNDADLTRHYRRKLQMLLW